MRGLASVGRLVPQQQWGQQVLRCPAPAPCCPALHCSCKHCTYIPTHTCAPSCMCWWTCAPPTSADIQCQTSYQDCIQEFESYTQRGYQVAIKFRHTWYILHIPEHTCARSCICWRTCASTAVGSAVASLPSTRIMLLSLTLGLGGSSRPCLIRSCKTTGSTNVPEKNLLFYGHCSLVKPSRGHRLYLSSSLYKHTSSTLSYELFLPCIIVHVR